MNVILSISTILSLVIHVLFFRSSSLVHTGIVCLGLLTSVLNHTSTIPILKYIDRGIISLGFLSDMYFLPVRFHIVLAALSFFISKLSALNELHVLAHALVTWGHILKPLGVR